MPKTAVESKRRIPWWIRLGIGLALLFALAVATVYVLGRSAEARWQRYATALREAGEPLTEPHAYVKIRCFGKAPSGLRPGGDVSLFDYGRRGDQWYRLTKEGNASDEISGLRYDFLDTRTPLSWCTERGTAQHRLLDGR